MVHTSRLLFVSLGALGAFALIASSCSVRADRWFDGQIDGSGVITTESYELGDFDKIDLCCGLDVGFEISTDGDESVSIKTDDNLQRHLDVDVAGDTLMIDVKNNKGLDTTGAIVVSVAGRTITALDIDSGTVAIGDFPTVDAFTLTVTDGSDAEITIDSDSLTIAVADGSTVDLAGRGAAVDVTAADGSDIRMRSVDVEEATVDAHDGSTIELEVSGSIDGKASDGSDIDIWGDPATMNVTSDEGSEVNEK